MRTSIFLLIAQLGIICGVRAQTDLNGPFRLTVDLSRMKIKPAKLFFSYDRAGAKIHDSAMVKGNLAIFRGQIDEPVEAYLWTEPEGALNDGTNFFVTPGNIKLVTTETLSGTQPDTEKLRKDFDTLQAWKKAYEKEHVLKLTPAEKAVRPADELAYIELEAKKERQHNAMLDAVYKPFIGKYASSSFAALYALDEYAGNSTILIRAESLATTDSLFRLLSPALQSLPRGRALQQRINKALSVDIGKTAPAFTQSDTAGKPVSLAAFRGHYVLIDFWASWCHWCRAETPYLLEAYRKYHDQKFDILQVSLDTRNQEAAWRKAIVTDHTGIWYQVCELSNNNSVAALYGVQSIPQNFLIDPVGRIVAINLRGSGLMTTLDSIIPHHHLP